jgi:hypothetical protein
MTPACARNNPAFPPLNLCTPPDITPPKLWFTSSDPKALTIDVPAAAGAPGVSVDFPAMEASDTNPDLANAMVKLLGRVVCNAPLGTSPLWTPVLPKGTQTGPATLFPVGSTLVVCSTTDAAGNVSPAVSFSVTVRCPDGYALKGGVCKGAHVEGAALSLVRIGHSRR